jgi:hypothetical protein
MARKQGILTPEDFQQLCRVLKLEEVSLATTALYYRAVEGWSIPEIAKLQRRSEDETLGLLQGLMDRWEKRAGYSALVHLEYWRTLLEVMQGPPPGKPASPLVGFDAYHPNDPEHARKVQVRGKMLTPEDLAYGDGHWRKVSLVEAAHRDKPRRRIQREKKERRKRVKEEREE